MARRFEIEKRQTEKEELKQTRSGVAVWSTENLIYTGSLKVKYAITEASFWDNNWKSTMTEIKLAL